MSESVFGEILYEGIDDSTNGPIVTPWMPRMGNAAVFGIEVLSISGTSVFWAVQHKNSEDADPSFASLLYGYDEQTTADVYLSSVATGIKELVRYVLKTGGTASMDWAQVRVLAPSWQTN